MSHIRMRNHKIFFGTIKHHFILGPFNSCFKANKQEHMSAAQIGS